MPYSKSRLFWFATLAVLGCGADLMTKQLVFQHPKLFRGSEWWLWQGHVGIQKSLNEGALFGMGQGQVWFFALFSLAALVAIPIWLFWFHAAQDRWLNTALGCVTGGICGNLYDRVGLPGLDWGSFIPSRAGERVYAVRDWILVQWDDRWVWPNFNIADMLLVGGAGLLVIQAFYLSPSTTPNDEATESLG
jgi:signal peptidase II